MKLQLILLYLASRDSITSLQYAFRIPKNTIYTFLPGVLFAIYEVKIKVKQSCYRPGVAQRVPERFLDFTTLAGP